MGGPVGGSYQVNADAGHSRQSLPGLHGAQDVVEMINSEQLNKAVRVYPGQGVRVGCTFITKEAVWFIVDELRRKGMVGC